MRTLILHGHIFKNAGTTLDWSLARNFAERFFDHRDDDAMRAGAGDYLREFLSSRPEIDVLSSHHLNFPLPKIANTEILACYLLRHPITRIRSVYNFERQQKSESLGARTAKRLNFVDYVLWRMRDDVPNTIRDYQTTYLSGSQLQGQRTYTNYNHYQAALGLVKGNSFVGVVDRYDESMVVFEHFFASKGLDLDLSYKPQNVLDDSPDVSEEVKMLDIMNDLGSEGQRVFMKNSFDYLLYQHANFELDRRIGRINNFDQKLEKFRARCHSH